MDGYDTWKEKLSLIPGLNTKVSEYLQRTATAQDREDHIDTADLLLHNSSNNQQTFNQPHKYDDIIKLFQEDSQSEIEALMTLN